MAAPRPKKLEMDKNSMSWKFKKTVFGAGEAFGPGGGPGVPGGVGPGVPGGVSFARDSKVIDLRRKSFYRVYTH